MNSSLGTKTNLTKKKEFVKFTKLHREDTSRKIEKSSTLNKRKEGLRIKEMRKQKTPHEKWRTLMPSNLQEFCKYICHSMQIMAPQSNIALMRPKAIWPQRLNFGLLGLHWS
jgi:hypothetical protein